MNKYAYLEQEFRPYPIAQNTAHLKVSEGLMKKIIVFADKNKKLLLMQGSMYLTANEFLTRLI